MFLAYFSLISAAVFMSFGLGSGVQLFFSMFRENVAKSRVIAVILLAPVQVMVTAIMTSELLDAALDAIQDAGFTYVVGYIGAMIGNTSQDMLDRIRRGIVVILVASFWIPFVIGGWMFPENPSAGAGAYASVCSIVAVVLLALAQIVAKTVVAQDDEKIEALDMAIAQESVDGVGRLFGEAHVAEERTMQVHEGQQVGLLNRGPPGTAYADGRGWAAPLVELEMRSGFDPAPVQGASRPWYPAEPKHVVSRSKFLTAWQADVVILLAFLLFSVVLLVMIIYPIFWKSVFYGLWMPAMLLLAVGLMALLPLNGCFLCVVLMYFVVGTCLVSGMMALVQVPPEKGALLPPQVDWNLIPVGSESEWRLTQSMLAYPVCKMRWGQEQLGAEYQMDIVDFADFAWAAYGVDDEERINYVNRAFEGQPLGEGIELEDSANNRQVGSWAVFKVPKAKMRIVALRGTTTIWDVLADADLWGSIVILQMFSRWVPIFGMVHEQVIGRINNVLTHFLMFNQPPLWDVVEQAAIRAMLRSKEDGFMTVVTGHSLGGGLTQIIATRQQLPGVAFSPVGVKYSLHRFGMWPHVLSLFQSVTAVVPEKDIVPDMDAQLGFVQRIVCRNGANFAQCHNMFRTECELFAVCGSKRHAHLNAACAATFKEEWVKTQGAVELQMQKWASTHLQGAASEL